MKPLPPDSGFTTIQPTLRPPPPVSEVDAVMERLHAAEIRERRYRELCESYATPLDDRDWMLEAKDAEILKQ